MSYLEQQFQAEEELTKDFLTKLTKFKKASKEIKTKNILQVQRLEWTKEYQHFARAERQYALDLDSKLLMVELTILPSFQNNFQDEGKFFLSTLSQQLNNSYNTFNDDIWYQVQNFKRLTNAFKFNTKNQQTQKKAQLPPIRSNSSKKQQLPKPILKNNTLEENEQIIQIKQMASTIRDFFSQLKVGLNKQYEEVTGIKDIQLDADNNEIDESSDYQDSIALKQRVYYLINQVTTEYQEDKLILIKNDQMISTEESQLLEEYSKGLSFLFERYQLELQNLEKSIEKADNALNEQVPSNLLPINDHLKYLANGNSKHVMQRLQLHYPKYGRSALQAIVDWVRKCNDISKRIDIIFRTWKEEYNELQGKSEQLLQNLLKDELEMQEKQKAQLQLKQHRLEVQENLEEKRAIYDERQKQIKEAEEQERLQEEIEMKKREEEWLKHKAEIAAKAFEFKQTKQEKQYEKILEDQAIQLEKARQIEQEILKAKPKIQMRQAKEMNKIYDKQLKQEINEMEQEYNNQRIENAIQNYQIRPKIERDPNRLVQETEAREIRKKTTYDKADKILLSNVNGYNIQELMHDMRYRIQTTLAEAGLSHATYGKEILLHLSKPNN